VILTVLFNGLVFAGFDILVQVGAAVFTGILIFVGSVKGTPGLNQYGPDPLANIARKSAT
jgi:hypothetical protein